MDQVLAAARRRSVEEAIFITNRWNPHINQCIVLAADAVEVILTFLPESDIPVVANRVTAFYPATHWAEIALVGLHQFGPVFEDPRISQRILDKWDRIFKWIAFMFFARIQALDKSDKRRAEAIQLISLALYSLCARRGPLYDKIASTPTCIELAMRLWLEEDEAALGNGPPTTALLLHTILTRPEHLNRALTTVDGKADAITKIAMVRLKRVLDARPLNPVNLTAHFSAMNAFSRIVPHPLRFAFLSENALWYATRALGPISTSLAKTHDPSFIHAMMSAILIPYNHIDSPNSFIWVSQAVGAGLLTYFADCSPYFSGLESTDLEFARRLIQKLCPHTVYRSVLEAMEPSMKRINEGSKRKKIMDSPTKDTWLVLEGLYNERVAYLNHSRPVDGELRVCDNIKCQRRDDKEEVRRCAACLTTFYCSKECQAIAWKEGNHKEMCKLKQRERMEGKPEKISRRNIKFFYCCATLGARRNIASLIDEANRKYPDKPYYRLIIEVDFSVIPTAYNVHSVEEYDFDRCTMNGLPTRARVEAMIEKVQKHPETLTLVATTVPVGLFRVRSFMATAPYKIWQGFQGGGPAPDLAGLQQSSHSGPSGRTEPQQPGSADTAKEGLYEGFLTEMYQLLEQEGSLLDDE